MSRDVVDSEQLLNALEDRVLSLERQVFGDDLTSKIQQQRKIPDELVQINAQIHRAVRNRETILVLMEKIEKVLELLELEESSHFLGCEAKANGILAAEPLIRQTHGLIQQIDLDKMSDAMNSDAIRSLILMQGQLSKLRVTQMEQEDAYDEICSKVKGIEEAINVVLNGIEYP